MGKPMVPSKSNLFFNCCRRNYTVFSEKKIISNKPCINYISRYISNVEIDGGQGPLSVLRSEKKFSLFLRLKNEEEKTFSQNIK